MFADDGRLPEVVPRQLNRQGHRHDSQRDGRRTTRRHITDNAKPNKATNSAYGAPAAMTRKTLFDSGRSRMTIVIAENARANTASKVRSLLDKSKGASRYAACGRQLV